jgi:hypothetical protein
MVEHAQLVFLIVKSALMLLHVQHAVITIPSHHQPYVLYVPCHAKFVMLVEFALNVYQHIF